METDLMEKILSLAKRRGFVFPGSEIYGGLQNAWDFGPLGVELKRNIKAAWWNRFIHRRSDMTGIDASILMNTKVWEASGHLKNFSDPLVECEKCHKRFRFDEVIKDLEQFDRYKDDPEGLKEFYSRERCPLCGANFSFPRQFNLMLKTHLGATEDKASEVYFRPETAQGIFVNFKNILDTKRMDLPFGVGQIGKAFRNEITPGNFIFRTREFEQMEIEYFIPVPKSDGDWNKYFEMWRKEMIDWTASLGVDVEKEINELEVPKEELAHYSKRTIDFEYHFPFGAKELYGLAYRTDFDLKNHGERSGVNLKYKDPETGEEFYPHVIEPTFGVERSVLAAMCSAYAEEQAPSAGSEEKTETRVVMRFPKWLAPVKVAVLPLSKKEELSSVARPLAEELRRDFIVDYDETQSIGKRYRRQDEIGTPYCVTIDFDSLNDHQATVRDRDTMKQERVAISEIKSYLLEQFKK
ncbi:MAG: glycine--tRNA ligase [Patescibacteria group bacterium]|nr:glycine--tRNA ligase [Patescibacteria group bacterium]MCL5262092.1 glycine--tRNA ligase [Patescibacteria group bacterium]